ncbi:hypothetical protein KKF34_09905 [Myxococcota bacterium]|nr:hypothetical protein [Myxococcota bacterium]MBU1383185.1 hypothetical protein [Myxococcota bacterium]MBU1497179.1 hypothetical protein [Myxococcota bacterium]
MKKIITGVLLLFVVATIGFVVYKKTTGKAGKLEIKEKDRIVYYFHATKRCYTCNLIEKQVKKSLDTNFSKELADGTIKFVSVNLDKSENEHFVNDFKLKGRVVVLAYMLEGKAVYKRMDDVFKRVREGDAFLDYVKNEVNTFLLKRN